MAKDSAYPGWQQPQRTVHSKNSAFASWQQQVRALHSAPGQPTRIASCKEANAWYQHGNPLAERTESSLRNVVLPQQSNLRHAMLAPADTPHQRIHEHGKRESKMRQTEAKQS